MHSVYSEFGCLPAPHGTHVLDDLIYPSGQQLICFTEITNKRNMNFLIWFFIKLIFFFQIKKNNEFFFELLLKKIHEMIYSLILTIWRISIIFLKDKKY